MKLSEFFCDYCNPSKQRREEGDEVNTGYAVELADGYPLGWWEVPRKGPQGTPGHACPNCVLHNDEAKADIAKRRAEDTAHFTGEIPVFRDEAEEAHFNEGDLRVQAEGPGVDPGATTTSERTEAGPSWPSISSPFEGSRDGGDGNVG